MRMDAAALNRDFGPGGTERRFQRKRARRHSTQLQIVQKGLAGWLAFAYYGRRQVGCLPGRSGPFEGLLEYQKDDAFLREIAVLSDLQVRSRFAPHRAHRGFPDRSTKQSHQRPTETPHVRAGGTGVSNQPFSLHCLTLACQVLLRHGWQSAATSDARGVAIVTISNVPSSSRC
jgi:hypothetical protein